MADAIGISGKIILVVLSGSYNAQFVHHHKTKNADATADHGMDQSKTQTNHQYFVSVPRSTKQSFKMFSNSSDLTHSHLK
jgi:hypothetical protein